MLIAACLSCVLQWLLTDIPRDFSQYDSPYPPDVSIRALSPSPQAHSVALTKHLSGRIDTKDKNDLSILQSTGRKRSSFDEAEIPSGPKSSKFVLVFEQEKQQCQVYITLVKVTRGGCLLRRSRYPRWLIKHIAMLHVLQDDNESYECK